MGYSVAIVGATGVVGHEILNSLYEREFPVTECYALASRRSANREVSFGDQTLTVKAVDDFDFSKVDLVFFSAGAEISKQYAPIALEKGAFVIDNTSHFRMDEDKLLIVPEVNGDLLDNLKGPAIIPNPNCSTIQMVMALKPLHDAAGLKRVIATTYQSVSGAGKEAMDELFDQSRKFFVNDRNESTQFSKQIAFNVIPQIDVFLDDGQTKEEWKMVAETRKILGTDCPVSATCVRVPVFIGHGVAVHAEFDKPLTAKEARKVIRSFPGVSVIDLNSDLEFVTPVEIAGEDDVYVSRVRNDTALSNGLAFWCVADNLRKGAALNSVQIAESLHTKNLIQS